MKIFSHKLFFIFICLVALRFLGQPFSAAASVIILKPNVITVQVGATFKLPVKIDPIGIRQYTTRFVVNFQASSLQVTSFSFAKNWIVVSQPGYDLIDNKTGELIKTAGFPAGFLESTAFGTITFRALKAGQAVITVGTKAFILNAESKNTLESRPRVAVSINVTPTPSIVQPLSPLSNLPVVSRTPLFDVQVGPARGEPAKNPLFIILIILAGIVLGGTLIFYIRKRQNN